MTMFFLNQSEIISYICRRFWQQVNCRNCSMTRKSISNCKNQ